MANDLTNQSTTEPAQAGSLQPLVRALRAIEAKWPNDVWLFAASGKLHLMRKRKGKRVVKENGGMDDAAVVATFDRIECDGGDW